jgi:hypothetical protein
LRERVKRQVQQGSAARDAAYEIDVWRACPGEAVCTTDSDPTAPYQRAKQQLRGLTIRYFAETELLPHLTDTGSAIPPNTLLFGPLLAQ